MQKVLIIEDDKDIVELLDLHLKDMGFSTSRAMTGHDGLQAGLAHTYDLVILDLMLPGIDGIEICRRLRAAEMRSPILMLTARSEEIDKVLGLEMGADDYLTKPFGIREFLARVKALMRRTQPVMIGGAVSQSHSEEGAMVFGELVIEPEKHKVSLSGQRIDLSPKEFELLHLLASRPGRSYSREQILNLVWGYDYDGMAHTVNAHINRLRNKIEPDMNQPTYILTTWGVGYRFSEEIP
ncbi:MAG: response regulator transcription factor [Bacteroidia bacterium]|nr:response regulator transcription factor [Bacteroidia bacterium]